MPSVVERVARAIALFYLLQLEFFGALCGDVAKEDGEAVFFGVKVHFEEGLLIRVELFEGDGSLLADGFSVVRFKGGAQDRRKDIPEVLADKILPVRDLLHGPLVEKGELPVFIEQEDAVACRFQNLQDAFCGVFRYFFRLRDLRRQKPLLHGEGGKSGEVLEGVALPFAELLADHGIGDAEHAERGAVFADERSAGEEAQGRGAGDVRTEEAIRGRRLCPE